MYLYANLWKVNLQREFFPCVHVRIVRFFERTFKFVQLKCRESCAIPPVFLLWWTLAELVCREKKKNENELLFSFRAYPVCHIWTKLLYGLSSHEFPVGHVVERPTDVRLLLGALRILFPSNLCHWLDNIFFIEVYCFDTPTLN